MESAEGGLQCASNRLPNAVPSQEPISQSASLKSAWPGCSPCARRNTFDYVSGASLTACVFPTNPNNRVIARIMMWCIGFSFDQAVMYSANRAQASSNIPRVATFHTSERITGAPYRGR